MGFENGSNDGGGELECLILSCLVALLSNDPMNKQMNKQKDINNCRVTFMTENSLVHCVY